MQLILRTTSRCNFKCTFCSASKLHSEMPLDKAISYIKKYQPLDDLIFEGGDPLCVKPSYYQSIIDLVDAEELQIKRIGFTSNLWDFYKRPEKWLPIFKHPKVQCCTSFQYGNKRQITEARVYTESMFREIYSLYTSLTNKSLSFISVIDQDNDWSVMKTVQLAKELGTVCKINALFPAGRVGHSFYPADKMLSHYRNIICSGLSEYENNSYYILHTLLKDNQSNDCPWVKQCNRGIRCITPDGSISTCSIENSWLEPAPLNKNSERDITLRNDLFCIKEDCLLCSCYFWCNSCKILVLQGQQQPINCQLVKECIRDIEDYAKSHSNY